MTTTLVACDKYAPRLGASLSVAEILLLESLPDDVRRAIHKYGQIGGNVKLVTDDVAYFETEHSADYLEGWEDAMRCAQDEVDGIHLPSTPPRRRR
jgi:hypothetical protein